MIKKYSIVFYPSPTVIAYVKTLKEQLKSKIDWYSSCNSVAHITICEFEIDEAEMDKIKQKLIKISDTFIPSQVDLNHFAFYENSGAFYIGLKEESSLNLKPIMKKIHAGLKSLKLKKSEDPHVSIGRKLTAEKLTIASELFTQIDLNFICDSLVLRELDPIKKQFFVIDTFPFGNNPQPELIQGSLF